MVDTTNTVIWSSLFLLPGFLIYALKRRVNPNKQVTSLDSTLICLAYSLIVTAMLSWYYPLIYPYFQNDQIKFWLVLMLGELLATILVGLFTILFEKLNLMDRFLRLCGLNPPIPIPTAWDECFSNIHPTYVLIHLTSGEKIYGWLGPKSIVSCDPNNRDLFLDTVLDDRFDDSEVDKKDGIYISKDQIKIIEFMKPGRGE